MMTKKNFAAIKSAQETMEEIENIASDALDKSADVYEGLKKIRVLAAKWNKDFQECDPLWVKQQDTTKQPSAREQAIALGAFIQE